MQPPYDEKAKPVVKQGRKVMGLDGHKGVYDRRS